MDLKLLSTIGAAGAAGDSAIGVEDVFKTYLYEGNQTAKSINTGLDMTDGGMVWIKNRDNGWSHRIWDTERGSTKFVYPNDSNAQENDANGTTATMLESFNNNGFSVGQDQTYGGSNFGDSFVSWSFKKQEKFFTIKTYSGTNSTLTMSHDLGSVPGAIFVKRTDTAKDWCVYHRSLGSGKRLRLNLNNDVQTSNAFSAAPTATHFTVDVTTGNEANASGGTFVAYLFAHEEAEFGPNSDQKIISCGSYTGTGAAGNKITLPFEPAWVMLKDADDNENWNMFDNMRGVVSSASDSRLRVDENDAEDKDQNYLDFHSDGFSLETTSNLANSGSGHEYVYIAIAAETGKTMKAIETPSDVFAMDTGNGSGVIPAFTSGFPVDFAFARRPASVEDWYTWGRLIQGKYLYTSSSTTEGNDGAAVFDWNTGFNNNYPSTYQSYMWKSHAGFDCITYDGTGSARTIAHSLGSNNVPEMIWTKKRNNTGNWHVYHKGLNGGTTPQNYYINLNTSDAQTNTAIWNNQPTSSVFHLSSDGHANSNGDDFIAILFSTVSGISKCGYHTCGAGNVTLSMDFSPRFLLLKNISTGSTPWVLIDTLRGITANAGNTPTLNLSSSSQQSNYTWIQSISSSGIEINAGQGSRFSNDGDNFIWYAHA